MMMQKIGIIGSGKMGQDIFNYLNNFDIQLVWFVRNAEKKEKIKKSYLKKLNRQLKHQLISQEQFDHKKDNQVTNALGDLKNCDLIIETIIEDQKAKIDLFSELKSIIQPTCAVVSNSSSVLPSYLSVHFPVAGMHFFYPVAFKNIVELILPDNYDSDKLEMLRSFLSSINKKYVIQDERNAFLLNRFLLDLQVKAFHFAIEQNIPLPIVDQVSQNIIPDFGLFEMMDHVGLSTMYQSIQNYTIMENQTEKYKTLLAYISEKIALEQPMLEINALQEVNKKSEAAILTFLQNKIQVSFNQYFLNKLNQDGVYKNAIKEFCGLEL